LEVSRKTPVEFGPTISREIATQTPLQVTFRTTPGTVPRTVRPLVRGASF
jgi:hypothetical protein